MNRGRTTRTLHALLAAGILGVAGASGASAQIQGQEEEINVTPPRPGKPDDSAPIFVTYLVLFVLVGAAIGANLMPPKRGHQD